MRVRIVTAALVALFLCYLTAGTAVAAEGPAYRVTASVLPTNVAAGEANDGSYPMVAFFITNIGAGASGTFTVTDEMPAGMVPTAIPEGCSFAAGTVTCTGSAKPGRKWEALIPIEVGLPLQEGDTAISRVEVSGGGGAAVGTTISTPITSAVPQFGFLPGASGMSASLTGPAGEVETLAGSHPYQLTVDLGFPARRLGGEGEITGAGGGLHRLIGEGPAGLLGNPAATPVLCTEGQLESRSCPYASAVGIVTVFTTNSPGAPGPAPSPLFNMVTPPGTPAEFGFDAAGVAIFVHVKASVRSDGDYGIDLITDDILARAPNPVLGVQLQLWGDPSDPAHDATRGACLEPTGPRPTPENPTPCAVPAQPRALLTTPVACPETLPLSATADSWAEIGILRTDNTDFTDSAGNPVGLTGCGALSYAPTVEAKPTTDLADSPSGLDVDLHQPQEQRLGHRSTGALRSAAVTLPEGMSVNPSQADGLAVCTDAEIGYLSGSEGVHFDKQPQSCPDASKLGTVEVTTPLLAEYEAGGTKPVLDPETGEPIPRALKGTVYLAKPFENPFGSLLGIYLAIEDPRSGTYAKLAGEVETDPQSGQLTTVFDENPQLPLEDVRLHLFGGSRGALITPPTCGEHTTVTTLTPWSAPEAPDAHPTSTFQTNAAPGGGACPSDAGTAPNSPAFTAGTMSPQAGSFSPFVLKLSREDGSQRLSGIDTVLAPGLIGKLAGIFPCSDGEIAQAESRSHPEEGRLERESPSCPASSRVGTVAVAAGAGPTPYYTNGTAYLAGPYKGAPLSLAVITPAIAGPFDLGTVVTRVALRLEPETAQIHAVSDPFPQILDGIPLDLRSVALKMDRPDFTLNPTSCDPLSITGAATSALGQVAALSQRFQVGGCSALPFKPKLSLRLKGSVKRSSNPRLIATLTAKPGEANISRAQVKLPHAVFLDQSHIRTVCTRVQFAADQCPAGSVYGAAEATTPLLGYPLKGSVYLRSSSHKLPDLVAKLSGPDYQPIEIDLVGKTDAVKGALRNTFEAAPDAPVSTFRLELFGGKRGLVEMSDGFCAARRATIQLTAHSGKVYDTRPAVGAKCPKQRRHGHKHGGKAK